MSRDGNFACGIHPAAQSAISEQQWETRFHFVWSVVVQLIVYCIYILSLFCNVHSQTKLFLTGLSVINKYWLSQNIQRLTFLRTNPSQKDAHNNFMIYLAFFFLTIISNFLWFLTKNLTIWLTWYLNLISPNNFQMEFSIWVHSELDYQFVGRKNNKSSLFALTSLIIMWADWIAFSTGNNFSHKKEWIVIWTRSEYSLNTVEFRPLISQKA